MTFPIGLCATSRFRMQAKFGKTMQKAMSHKMELHTKAGGACKVVIQPLKIPNIRRVLHLVIFSVCWAGSRASSQNRAHHSIQVGVLPPVARFFGSTNSAQVDSYTGDFFFIFRVASLIKGLATVLDIKAQFLWRHSGVGTKFGGLEGSALRSYSRHASNSGHR